MDLRRESWLENCSRQMALRCDHRARAVWRGHGLQRFGHHGAKREWQPVLLRDQARRLGRDRFHRDVAGDAVQLSATEEPSHRLWLLLICHDRVACQCLRFSSSNGAHRWIKFPGFSMQPSEISKLALDDFSCILPREARW